jgi:hypothetical protein
VQIEFCSGKTSEVTPGGLGGSVLEQETTKIPNNKSLKNFIAL